MISVIFGDPRGSLSCGLFHKNGILFVKQALLRSSRSEFFVLLERRFYGDS